MIAARSAYSSLRMWAPVDVQQTSLVPQPTPAT